MGRLGLLLKSPRLAALLLTLFTLACLVGNFVPQESTAGIETVAAWKSAHPQLSAVVAPLGGFRIYTSRWFVAIVALLALNTLACTLGQISRARMPLRVQTALPGPPDGVAVGTPEQVLAELRGTPIFSGLTLRTQTDQGGSLLVHGSSTAGRWGSVLLHLALVMVFATVVIGSMTSWSASAVLTEGQSFNPARQSLHGVQSAWLARPEVVYRLPIIHLIRHYPRYRAAGYNPDAASRLSLEQMGRKATVVLQYGRPLNVAGLTLRQTRRYGAAALVTFSPSDVVSRGRSAATPPPPIGLVQPDPDGGLSVSLPFTNSQEGEAQKREIDLPVYKSPVVFRLAPGPAAADYGKSLAERFVLVLDGPVQASLKVGDHLDVPGGELRFESLDYWTVLSAGSAPLTPWFFVAGWLVAIGGALGVLFPLRRIQLDLRPGSRTGTCEVRFRAPATRGSGLFVENARATITALFRDEAPSDIS